MNHAISPRGLSLYRDCQACFYRQYREKIARPSGPFPSLPSGIDAILKREFDAYRDAGTLPQPLAALRGEAHLFADTALMRVWRDNRRGIRWTNERGHTLYGAVDNILERKDGALIVLDYKTRGFALKEDTAEHYHDQMDVYNLLLRKNGYKTADDSLLLFYYPSGVEESGAIRFTTQLVCLPVREGVAQDLFDAAIKTLDGEMPAPSDGCGFCSWASKVRP